ncbi:TetR/AcrR family transcriptional regulator [Flavobacterium gyeonganense]|uniref:TetR/AcrR family transcriptional regulator n=1 Tax=Flavobacterium gyeonganense TaxID=1310418 RepID=UPI0024142C45|nr:TetR/AcrR family transcriptional regulator [Flavobacterium gyeonganense]
MRTRDVNKEEIVKQKAIEMLVKYGVEGFGMNRLAKESGVSVATLYIYYSDKEDLIKKIGSEIGQTFFCEMVKDFSPTMSFREGLRKQWENRARFALKNPLKVACWEALSHSSYRDDILEESLANFKKTMWSFIENALEKKNFCRFPLRCSGVLLTDLYMPYFDLKMKVKVLEIRLLNSLRKKWMRHLN